MARDVRRSGGDLDDAKTAAAAASHSAADAQIEAIDERAPSIATSAPSTAADAAPAIDMGVIKTLRERRPDLLVRLVKTYLSYAPTALSELDMAVRDGDHAAVGRLAHSLKSSSANLGAGTLSAICRQLEMSAKEKRLPAIKTQAAQLHDGFATVKAVLEAEIEGIETEAAAKKAAS